MKKKNRNYAKDEEDSMLQILKERFAQNIGRHEGVLWDNVKNRLVMNPEKLNILYKMEETGGEPDVVLFDKNTEEYLFFDCSKESPKGRRSFCYDRNALNGRKENKPKNSAMDMAAEMGIEILTENQYRILETLGEFDTKTSSWVQTPKRIRELGGAIFCDRRYDTTFVYHNGAESYYSSRGFRGLLKV